jgi:hypothetical protein
MTRWFPIALFALALSACTGCESTPDASATSGSTAGELSQHRDATCAAAIGGCSETCPQSGALAASEPQVGAVDGEAGFTCPENGHQGCVDAHSAAVQECPHPGSHAGCPVLAEGGSRTANEGCSEACPAHQSRDASATTAGCARAGDPDTK